MWRARRISGTVTETWRWSGTTVDLYDTVNGGTPTLWDGDGRSTGGSWTTSAPITLAAGTNSIVAQDTDLAGNTGLSTPPVVYTLETTAPAVAITSTGGATNQASQMLSGTVTET